MAGRRWAAAGGGTASAGCGVLLCGVLGLLGQPGWVWSAAMAACLAVRVRTPVVFAAAVTTLSAVHVALDGTLLLPGDVLLLVAVHSVAAHAAPGRRHLGLVLGGGHVAVVLARAALGPADAVHSPPDLLAVASPVALVAISITTAWALGLAARSSDAALREAHQRRLVSERDAEARALLVAHEERERLSDDMHDVLAHTLTSVVVQAESGRAVARDPEVAELFCAISSTSRTALHEVRRLLAIDTDIATGTGGGARPTPTLDDIDPLVGPLARCGLDVEVRREGVPLLVPPGLGLAVYRVVTEALTNALRHGIQHRAALTLTWEPDTLRVTVSNPVGPVVRAEPVRPHRGLSSMRRRCTLYGGYVEVEVTDHFTLRAVWPLGPDTPLAPGWAPGVGTR